MKARILVKTEVAALCFMLTVANGTYYWRVRAVDGCDAASTVRIRVEMRNSANTGIYYFDDVSITGGQVDNLTRDRFVA